VPDGWRVSGECKDEAESAGALCWASDGYWGAGPPDSSLHGAQWLSNVDAGNLTGRQEPNGNLLRTGTVRSLGPAIIEVHAQSPKETLWRLDEAFPAYRKQGLLWLKLARELFL
jgi:hypothetical protein